MFLTSPGTRMVATIYLPAVAPAPDARLGMMGVLPPPFSTTRQSDSGGMAPTGPTAAIPRPARGRPCHLGLRPHRLPDARDTSPEKEYVLTRSCQPRIGAWRAGARLRFGPHPVFSPGRPSGANPASNMRGERPRQGNRDPICQPSGAGRRRLPNVEAVRSILPQKPRSNRVLLL